MESFEERKEKYNHSTTNLNRIKIQGISSNLENITSFNQEIASKMTKFEQFMKNYQEKIDFENSEKQNLKKEKNEKKKYFHL